MEFKNIPVAAATEILKKYLKDEVLLITFDEKGGFTFTTDGSTEAHKDNAFKGAQHIVKILEKSGTLGKYTKLEIVEDPNNRFSVIHRQAMEKAFGCWLMANKDTLDYSNNPEDNIPEIDRDYQEYLKWCENQMPKNPPKPKGDRPVA